MIYFSFISFLILFSFSADLKPESKKKMIILSFFFVWLISSFRFEIGYDYNRYMNRIKYIFDFSNRIKIEYFSYLTLVLGNLIHPQLYFLINSSIQIILLYLFLRENSEDMIFSLLIFVLFPMFMLNSWSVVRNFTAILTTLYATKYIFNKNLKAFVLFVAIATLFHLSALVALPLYYIYEKEVKFKNFLIFTMIAFVVSNAIYKFRKFLPTRVANYFVVSNHKAGSKTILVLIFLLVVFAIMFAIFEVDRKLNRQMYFFYDALFIGVIMYLLLYKFSTISYRLTLYYYIYIIVLIPNAIKVFVREALGEIEINKYYIYIKYLIILLFIPMFIYMLIVGGESYYPFNHVLYLAISF